MGIDTGPIVVGVASTEVLDPVLPCALDLAHRTGRALHVVHAVEIAGPVRLALQRGGWQEELRSSTPDWCSGQCTEQLHEHIHRFRGEGEVHCHVRLGAPHDVLVRVSREVGAGLIVVGANRRGRIARNVVGPDTERVLRASPIPTLVVHAPFFHGIRRVLVATDLSESAAGVFEHGARLARGLAGGEPELHAVLVVRTPGRLPPALSLDAVRETARAELRRFLAARHTTLAPAAGTVRIGEPAQQVCEEADAWDADLIVLGVRGREWAVDRRVGSVAAATLRGTNRNLLVMPAEPLEDLPRVELATTGLTAF